jgi:hypothetical protein
MRSCIISNLLYIVTSMIISMNNVLFTTAVVVFASAFVIISSGVLQLAQACPDKSSTAASKVIPAAPSNTQLTQPSSSPQQLAIGPTA